MARIRGTRGERTAAAIREAGLRLIFEHGYEGMSLRDLARAVDLQPGSLYNHIATKQALLAELLSEHMHALTTALDEALAGVEGPVTRLDAFVTFHLRYHLSRRMEVFVVNSELRSLEPENATAIRAMRRAYEKRLIDILADGMESGALVASDPKVAAYAILALLTGVVTWYRPDGRLSADEVVAVHRDIVFRGLLPAGACGAR